MGKRNDAYCLAFWVELLPVSFFLLFLLTCLSFARKGTTLGSDDPTYIGTGMISAWVASWRKAFFLDIPKQAGSNDGLSGAGRRFCCGSF